MAKWTTNKSQIHSQFENENCLKQISFNMNDENETSILGVRWNPSNDTFKYVIKLPSTDEKSTKRSIVSHVARLYDPNGYLAAVVIRAKILIQKLWISNCSWDQKVPCDLERQWKQALTELPELAKVEIPRWIQTEPGVKVELHGFSDASTLAYGCVIYIKTIKANETTVNLVMAKTRVAPLKRSTVSRFAVPIYWQRYLMRSNTYTM